MSDSESHSHSKVELSIVDIDSGYMSDQDTETNKKQNQTQNNKQRHISLIQTIGGVIGNILEWYDFAAYGYLAVELAYNFFPSTNNSIALLETYGSFAGAFFIRPIGGIFFGIFGDKKGRKFALQVSMSLMFICTFIMGCLPTYNQIGITATILMIILRLIQGFSVGGEIIGSILYLCESCNPSERGYYGALATVGSNAGLALGAWIVTIFHWILSEKQMLNWGWRLPFLLSFIIAIIGFITRFKITESLEFELEKKNRNTLKNPFNKAILNHWKTIIFLVFVISPFCVSIYGIWLWLPHYYVNISNIASIVNASFFIWILICVGIGGKLSDKFTYYKIMKISTFINIFITIPLFYLISSYKNLIWPFILLEFLMGITVGFFNGAIQHFLYDSVKDVMCRYCVIGTAYNLSMALFGGTMPIISEWFNNDYSIIYVGVYIAACNLLSFILLLFKSQSRAN